MGGTLVAGPIPGSQRKQKSTDKERKGEKNLGGMKRQSKNIPASRKKKARGTKVKVSHWWQQRGKKGHVSIRGGVIELPTDDNGKGLRMGGVANDA